MITIIHPSRSRPEQAYKTAQAWIEKIGLPETEFEYVLSIDHSDPYNKEYVRTFPCKYHIVIEADNKTAIEAINIAAQLRSHNRKSGDFLIVISDDFDCPEGWGYRLNHLVEDDRVYKTFDGIQHWIITLPIMGWEFYNRFGYVYHPSYKHMFCDTELTCVAELTGKGTKLSMIFNHLAGSIPKDELNERNDATFESGRKIFIERLKRNFDLNPEQIKGQLTDNVYTRMI